MPVAILQRPRPGGFRHHDLLAVGPGNLPQYRGQILRRAVPVGVAGGGKDIVVHTPRRQLRGDGGVPALPLRVGEVQRHTDVMPGLCRSLTYRSAAGVKELRQGIPGAFAAALAVGFVAHLHHTHVHAALQQRQQAAQGVVRKGLRLFVQRKLGPGLRRLLLGGVGPEVGVVEVNQHPQPRVRGPLSHDERRVQVVSTAAIAVSLSVPRIVPDA